MLQNLGSWIDGFKCRRATSWVSHHLRQLVHCVTTCSHTSSTLLHAPSHGQGKTAAPRAHVAISSGFVQHVHRLLTHVSLLQGLWGVNTTVLLMVFSETIGVLLNKTQPKAAKFMVDQGHPQRKPELVGVKASAEGKPRSHGHCCTAVAWLRQQ